MDFGAHIPFARFMTFGGNTSFEVPFFAGKGMVYHYFFDFYVGIFEFLGMRLDVAFNVVSTLSILFLLTVIYKLAFAIFKNKYVGLIACLFLLLNSDLSFVSVIKQFGGSLTGIYNHNQYIVGELWGVNMKGNFLNINAFLNQRHLIFGLLWFFYILFVILKTKLSAKSIAFVGVIIGVFPFWHVSALASLYIILIAMSLAFKDKKKQIAVVVAISFLLSLPQLYLIKSNSLNTVEFYPGFLIHDNFSIKSFLVFWFWNLGSAIPLAIVGFMKSKRQQKLIFLGFMTLFVFANLFKFSRDIFDNHKFFNVWIVSINILAAWGIVQLAGLNLLGKAAAVVGLVLMISSGLLHLLVVKNGIYATIPDYKSTKLMQWVSSNTSSSSIALTNADIYDPASLAGKRTFLGRAQYIYLYGGDPTDRVNQRLNILSGENYLYIKDKLSESNIEYVILYKKEFIINGYKSNSDFFNDNFKKIYENNQGIVYKI